MLNSFTNLGKNLDSSFNDFSGVKAQNLKYKDEILKALNVVLENGEFILGKEVLELESNLAKLANFRFCVAASSGTSALLLAFLALGLKENDEVITTPFSFIAGAEMLALLNIKPVFCDIDKESLMLDSSLIETYITKRTKAILAVNLFGGVCDLASLREISDKYNLALIEDNAQSFGYTMLDSSLNKYKPDISITSFFPSKILGGCGDGGAVFCDDENLKNTLNLLHNHGQREKYNHEIIGLNARLDSMNAAILNVKLKYLKDEINTRLLKARIYFEAFKDLKNIKVLTPKLSVFSQFCLFSDKRDKAIKFLESKQIKTAIHYPLIIPHQKAFLNYLDSTKSLVNAINAASSIFSIPFSQNLPKLEQEKIINAILELDRII